MENDAVIIIALLFTVGCAGAAIGIFLSALMPPKNVIHPTRKPAPIETGEVWVDEYVVGDVVIMRSQKRIDVIT